MKQELKHFTIGDSFGGNQTWISETIPRGGCAVITASDCCMYFDLYKGTKLCPRCFPQPSREKYVQLCKEIVSYLCVGPTGIDSLEPFMDGLANFMKDQGGPVMSMRPFPGSKSLKEAQEIISHQIDNGFPIPCLTLHHKQPAFQIYDWHWYLLMGYEQVDRKYLVKAVTYGRGNWLDLSQLWETGYDQKGGLVLFSQQ